METGTVYVVLLMGLGLTLTTATPISDVCTEPPATGIAHPEISDVFRVDVECSMHEQNRTIFVREVYDYHNNRGRITQIDAKGQGDAFYDYTNNEIIVVDTVNKGCLVANLTLTDDSWTFGYKPDKKNPGHYHIFGASGALHFGDTNEKYMGRRVVRGIVADRWDSCQYSAALNATMTVSWYFSARSHWDMQLGAQTAPLRAEVAGKRYNITGDIVKFNHTYDLYNYEMNVDSTDFEIPVGVVCPGRVNAKPFPTFPNRFSFVAEILDYGNIQTTYLEENYDGVANINMFRYKRATDMSQQIYMDRILQVNDYNTGVTYMIDTVEDSCQMKELGADGTVSFINVLPNGKMTMKDPAQFFADSSPNLFTYAGVRTTRDIPCDVWVGRTNKIQYYTDRYLTVEWYFAVSSDKESWYSQANKWRLPVQFRMWDKGEDDAVWELNVFYYDTVRPNLINADVSPCFRGAHRRRFTFDIDGASRDAVYNNVEEFKYVLASTIADHTGISQLRVADIEIYNDVNVMHVSFDLLDKPTISGANTANLTMPNDLAAAVSLYNGAINDRSFQLPLTRGVQVQTITPVFGSSAEVGVQSGSFTTGALAGLGVAMLVVGSAGGAGAAFFFFK